MRRINSICAHWGNFLPDELSLNIYHLNIYHLNIKLFQSPTAIPTGFPESLAAMDPLSISAGATGFLSLGITATKGVIVFCQDYQSRDGDIDSLLNKAEKLKGLVNLVTDRMQKCGGPDDDLKTLLTDCFRATQDCTSNCKEFIKRMNPQGDRYGRKSRMKLLAYPFKDKRRLSDLTTQITEFQSALATYLQLMNLYVSDDRTHKFFLIATHGIVHLLIT